MTTAHTKGKQAGLILLSVLAVWLADLAYMNRIGGKVTSDAGLVVTFIGFGAFTLVLYLAAVKWIERRRAEELALAGAGRELGTGALAGLALFSLLMTILWLTGAYRPQGWGGANALGVAVMAVFWLGVAVEEEILWRGLLYRLCAKVFGTWGAVLLSAGLFSAKHMLDSPDVTFPAFVGVLVGGVFFAAAYAATGRLWLPIGLHCGWNFAEGTLFGTDVSGTTGLGPTLFTGKLTGPPLWTGGQFGPEASIAAWTILITSTAYLSWRTTASKRVEPPIWRDATAICAQEART